MSPWVRILIALMGISLFIVVLELVRRKQFREELSLVWLFVSLGIILSSFADHIIDPIAFALGLTYPPVLVFVLIQFVFLLAILYFSKVVSDLKSRNKELSQKVALMEFQINSLNERQKRP
jgi:uncharacterized membrane protein (DUF485 family)